MYLSRYIKIYPAKQNPDHFLLYSTLRNSTVIASGSILRALQSGYDIGFEAETLRRLGMLVEDPGRERDQMRTMVERANRKCHSFRAIAVLNLDCNLDCSYCYEGNFRGNHYMSEKTAQQLVETLRDRISAGMDLSITFYGGEPLLSDDLIRGISLPLLQAAKLQGVKYSFDLVTNGTLLNRQSAQRLIPLGLRGAKFTLDGPREIHDRQRPYASGSGSFDTIVDNIADIWDIVPVHLGGNFRQENYRSFPRLLDHLIGCGLTPEKIARVVFTPVTGKAGCSEHSSGCSRSSEPWLAEACAFLREETMVRGFAVLKPMVSACMVEFADTMVVNCDGSLYKCPALMAYEGLSIGSLADGISDYSASHGLGNWQTDECLDCPYLPLCFGGCRFLNLLQGKPLSEVECRREVLDATLENFILQNMAHSPEKAAPAGSASPQTGAGS